jgi:signal transduction histidine kinase
MPWLVRRALSPVHELAYEAERISSSDWRFDVPASAKATAELRPLASALEAALERLHRSFQQQRRFTNDAAHELKTDMAIVRSSLQLLSMRRRSVDEYRDGLALCLEDLACLESTVQKMLTLALLEQPAETAASAREIQFCSLRDAIAEAVHQSKPLAQLKTIKVSTELSGDVRVPIDDRDALLLCSNILLNALQHSPEGESVRIASSRIGNDIRLVFEDHGEGVSEKDRASLFEPFYRGDQSRSRTSGSTGLGLSICKAICERASGSINIANRASGGAVVTVRLPAESLLPDKSASSALLKPQ